MFPSKILLLATVVVSLYQTATTYAMSEFGGYARDLAKAGIIDEKENESGYRLDASVTRAEIAKIAVKLAGKETVRCSGTLYSDVSSNLGNLCGYIEAAAEAGIASRIGTLFRPADSITRAEMIKMLLIANKIPPSDTPSGFGDVPDSLGNLARYIHAGVAQGCVRAGSIFRPNDASSRGEAFKVASCLKGLSKPASASVTTNGHDGNFAPDTLKFLQTNTGLDGEQWDNIMKLVNKSEQDSLDWTASYGYCEDIGDDRGYTIGIFWATTGGPNDMWPDGPLLFQEFDAASGRDTPTTEGGLARIGARGSMDGRILKIADSASDFCAKINGLRDNPAWRVAVWKTFYSVYIRYSVEAARKLGFTDALAIGSFVDTALNQGTPSLGDLIAKSGNSPDERAFMKNFYEQRSKVVGNNQYNQASNEMKRVKQWNDLLDMWQWSLKNADVDIMQVTSWIME